MRLRELLKERELGLEITMAVPEFGTVAANLAEELNFGDHDLEEHIECQASMMAWWGVVLNAKQAEEAKLQGQYDLWYSMAYESEFKRLWAESGNQISKKPNISSVENMVRIKYRRPYLHWQIRLQAIKREVALLKDISNWWREKGQMLVQRAKLLSAEMSMTDMTIRRADRDVQKLQQTMKNNRR